MFSLQRRSVSQVVVIVLTFACVQATADISYRTVAMSGMQAPGTEAGTSYLGFLLNPVIDPTGKVAFHGILSGPGVGGHNNNGLWFSTSADTGLAIRAGDTVPTLGPGVIHRSLGSPIINSEGEVAFIGELAGPGISSTDNSVVWAQQAGALRLVAREGEVVPGATSGEVFTVFNALAFNDVGQAAWIGQQQVLGDVTSSRRGIWSEGAGSLNPVAIHGQQPPGMAPGVEYNGLNGLAMNNIGQTAFNSTLFVPTANNNYGEGQFSEVPGSLTLIAQRGETAVGSEPLSTFSGFDQPSINDAGDTVFAGGIDRNTLDDSGVWLHDENGLQVVIQTGQFAPVEDGGGKFGNTPISIISPNAVVNSGGSVAFYSNITGGRAGIWRDDGGDITTIARTGDDPPGGAHAEVFGFFVGPVENYFPTINSRGQVAFTTEIFNFSRLDLAREGIWATDMDDELVLIALEGELFDVNDDPFIEDLRTISSVNFAIGSGGEDGRPESFNDTGQLVFRLGFTDGSSGIFVANVPEPGSIAMFFGLLGIYCRRRRFGSDSPQ